MNDPRERVLAETIKNKLIGIQKSKQIYEQLSTWERKILKMNEKEPEKVSNAVAPKVHKWCMRKKDSGDTLSADMINQKVREELEKL